MTRSELKSPWERTDEPDSLRLKVRGKTLGRPRFCSAEGDASSAGDWPRWLWEDHPLLEPSRGRGTGRSQAPCRRHAGSGGGNGAGAP